MMYTESYKKCKTKDYRVEVKATENDFSNAG